jgi:hypothetical protein
MKKALATLVLLIGLAIYSNSSAIDPGSATGTLNVDGDAVALKYAYAHLHDNAEGWLDTNKEMRIVVSDREIPQETIGGLNPFFSLSAMVREGSVRGVFIRFDPDKPKSVMVTVLYPPKEQGSALANRMISNDSESPLENLRISELRVSAAMKQATDGDKELGWPSESYSFKFSAPLFKEPAVTAILKGKKALDSPQVKALLAKGAALKSGDLETVKRICSERSGRDMERFLAQSKGEAAGRMRESGQEIEQSIRTGKIRLIVRGERASLVVDSKEGKSIYGFFRKDGKWLVD